MAQQRLFHKSERSAKWVSHNKKTKADEYQVQKRTKVGKEKPGSQDEREGLNSRLHEEKCASS